MLASLEWAGLTLSVSAAKFKTVLRQRSVLLNSPEHGIFYDAVNAGGSIQHPFSVGKQIQM